MTPLRRGVALIAARTFVVVTLALLPRTGTALAAQQPVPLAPGSNLQVYLVTMGAGAQIYERFGHDAIWIRDTVARSDIVYNYGTFSAPTDLAGMLGFAGRFVMGRPQYWLDHTDLDTTLAEYRYFKRDLTAQELNLTPAERADLAARLADNALPEHRVYTYDYFRDNCSTRVRDMLDGVLGGALKRATQGKPAEGTLRFHTLRSITNNTLLFMGIDAALGPRVDRPLDQWDEMFLPGKVQDRVRELRVPGPDGTDIPLVAREFPLLTIGIYHVEPAPPNWGAAFAGIGIALALMIGLATLHRSVAVVGRVVGTAWLLLIGLGGMLLLFFWLCTANVATYANHNLLLLSPLALELVPAFWRRPHPLPGIWTRRAGMALVALLGVGVILTLLPGAAGQHNGAIALITTPPTLVASWVVLRRNLVP